MIKHIEITNFQSHLSTVIDFVPGVNVIVGGTNSGKSVIMRALRKVLRNDPPGNFFISWWGQKECSVLIDRVKRTVGSNGNVITVQQDTGNQVFTNGRGLPPAEVFNAIGISPPVSIDTVDEDFNFIVQKFPSFLLENKAYPPSLVAKFFDHLSGVGMVNLCVMETKTRINKINIANKDLLAKQVEYKKAIADLAYAATLQTLSEKSALLVKKRLQRTALTALRNNINQINATKRSVEALSKKVNQAAMFNRRASKLFNVAHILNIDAQLERVPRIDIKKLKIRCKQYDVVFKYAHIIKITEQVQDIISAPVDMFERVRKFLIYAKLKNLYQEIESVNAVAIAKQAEYTKLLKENGVCPVCGRKVE